MMLKQKNLIRIYRLFFLTPILVFIITNVWFLTSLIFMPAYTKLQTRTSNYASSSIYLNIPGGFSAPELNWYPFVLSYDPGSSFSSFSEIDADITIFYNFPDFSTETGASLLYEPDSPYYNSFYGAYLVQMEERVFGFTESGEPVIEEAVLVPKYDFQVLVMEGFSLSRHDSVFEWDVIQIIPDVSYVGYSGWYRVDAALHVSGSSHTKTTFEPAYLQYGPPPGSASEDFAPIDMHGRIYMRYFPEWDTSIFFYIIAADETVLDMCDDRLLSQSTLYETSKERYGYLYETQKNNNSHRDTSSLFHNGAGYDQNNTFFDIHP